MTVESLRERYIQEVARHLPQKQRIGVAEQLRTSIGGAVENRAVSGADTKATEWQILTELGDPAILADKHRGHEPYLIGPRYFPTYVALVRRLLTIIPPIIGVVVVLAQLISTDSLISSFTSGVWAAFQSAIHVLFWVTLVFVIIERTSSRTPAKFPAQWTPDRLPDRSRAAHIGVGEFVGGIAGIAFLAALVLWQRANSPFVSIDGAPIAFFEPGLWTGWIYAIFVALGALVAVEIAKFFVGHWTVPLAWANAGVNALFVAVLAALTYADRLVNPEFIGAIVTETASPELGAFLERISANMWAIVAVIAAIDTIIGFGKARAARQVFVTRYR